MDIPLLFIHISVDGNLGCYYFLAIANNIAMDIGIQMSIQDPAFNSFGYIHPVQFSSITQSYVKLLNWMVILCLKFSGNVMWFSTAAMLVHVPTKSVLGF